MPITSHFRDFQVTTKRFGDEAAIAGAIGAAGAIGTCWGFGARLNVPFCRAMVSLQRQIYRKEMVRDVSKVTNS